MMKYGFKPTKISRITSSRNNLLLFFCFALASLTWLLTHNYLRLLTEAANNLEDKFAKPNHFDPETSTMFLDEELPLPDERIDLTFFSTTRDIGAQQLTAIRSWLALGADVVVFADNLSIIHEVPTTLTASGTDAKERFRLFNTPLPRSLLGAPRLDLVIDAGEMHARTKWEFFV